MVQLIDDVSLFLTRRFYKWTSDAKTVNENGNKLLSGLEADRLLSEVTPLWMKLVFLATNIPYWIIACVAGYDWLLMSFFNETKEELHLCGHPAMYFLVGTTVALSSTIMHGSQMRLGHCFCCAHVERTEKFHEPQWQTLFKRVDIFCATSAVMACVACRAWTDLVVTFALALPLFVAGLFLKRLRYHHTYLLVHGLWHIVTSGLAWDAVLNK